MSVGSQTALGRNRVGINYSNERRISHRFRLQVDTQIRIKTPQQTPTLTIHLPDLVQVN